MATGCRALTPYRPTPTSSAGTATAALSPAAPPEPPRVNAGQSSAPPATAPIVAGSMGPLPACLSPREIVATVRYPPGWSLVAGASTSCLHGATAAYLVIASDAPRPQIDYLPAPVDAGLIGDQAYWVLFPSGGTLDLAANVALPQPPVPTSGVDTNCVWTASLAGNWTLLANGSPRDPLVLLSGSRSAFVYVPGRGYVAAASIPVGQAAWVWSTDAAIAAFNRRAAATPAPPCP